MGSSLALKDDGTVVAWEYNGEGETSVPTGHSGVAAIAAGYDFSLTRVGAAEVVCLTTGTSKSDNLYGTSGNDTIYGGRATTPSTGITGTTRLSEDQDRTGCLAVTDPTSARPTVLPTTTSTGAMATTRALSTKVT